MQQKAPSKSSKKIRQVILYAVLIILTATYLWRLRPVQGPVYTDSDGVMLEKYDAVALYDKKKLLEGTSQYSFIFNEGLYYFMNEANLNAFKSDPKKYAPLFGGYCAMGVLYGGLYPSDIETFSYVNDKLILQKNMSMRKQWDKDPQNKLKQAVEAWPEVIRQN